VSGAEKLADKITRVKADFDNRPPESLVRVLAIYAELTGTHPFAELERGIDTASRNAQAILAGSPGPPFPRHALVLQEPSPAGGEEAA